MEDLWIFRVVRSCNFSFWNRINTNLLIVRLTIFCKGKNFAIFATGSRIKIFKAIVQCQNRTAEFEKSAHKKRDKIKDNEFHRDYFVFYHLAQNNTIMDGLCVFALSPVYTNNLQDNFATHKTIYHTTDRKRLNFHINIFTNVFVRALNVYVQLHPIFFVVREKLDNRKHAHIIEKEHKENCYDVLSYNIQFRNKQKCTQKTNLHEKHNNIWTFVSFCI